MQEFTRSDPDGVLVRPAIEEDLPAITAIYNHAVSTSVATFHTNPRTPREQWTWLMDREPGHPVLVAVRDGTVIGWTALGPWSDREAYSGTVEVSTYVAASHRGMGVGRMLRSILDEETSRLGHHAVISLIADGNTASIHLNESLGFVRTGILREVGFKFGRRIDVVIMQKLYPLDTE